VYILRITGNVIRSVFKSALFRSYCVYAMNNRNVIRSVFKSALFRSYCVYATNNGNVIRSVFKSALEPLLELLQC
jgi:hypothetical protein